MSAGATARAMRDVMRGDDAGPSRGRQTRRAGAWRVWRASADGRMRGVSRFRFDASARGRVSRDAVVICVVDVMSLFFLLR
jgi:hypothetical protein